MSSEKIFNRVKQSCLGSGAGDLDIRSGVASVGHRKISSVLTAAEQTGVFVLESSDDWEIFVGTIKEVAGELSTLERTTVIESSNSGGKIDLQPTETHTVMMVMPEQYLMYYTNDGKIEKDGIIDAIGESIGSITSTLPPSPITNQISIKLGDASVGDNNGGVYYYLSGWNKLNLTNSIEVDDATIEINAASIRVKDLGITTAKIEEKNVTFSKIQDVSTNTIAGRRTAGNGSLESLTASQVRAILSYPSSEVSYDNTISGLTSNNVKLAIDEVVSDLDTINSSLGTISSQNSNSVAITGGSINGTSVGATTASTGNFSSVSINGTQVLTTQQSAISDISVTASAGSLPTPDGSLTISDASTPTVSELLEYCTELESKLESILSVLRTHGLIAS